MKLLSKIKLILGSMGVVCSTLLSACVVDTNNDEKKLEQYNQTPSPILSYLSENQNKYFELPKYSVQNKNVFDFFKRVIRISANGFLGTAWILGKSSDDENSFKYYVATNFHIARRFLVENPTQKPYKNKLWLNPFVTNEKLAWNKPSTFSNEQALGISENLSLNFSFDPKENFHWEAFGIQSKGHILSSLADDSDRNYSNWTVQLDKGGINIAKTDLLFGADFAVLELDFGLNQTEENVNNVLWNKFKNVLNELKPASFTNSFYDPKMDYPNNKLIDNQNIDSGYIAGFPGIISKTKSQIESRVNSLFVNLRLKNIRPKLKVDFLDDSQKKGGYPLVDNESILNYKTNEKPDKPIVYNDLLVSDWELSGFSADQKVAEIEKIQKQKATGFLTPTFNYAIPYLNLFPGSSGSLMLDDKGNILGIYWGVNYFSKNNDIKKVFSTFSQGNITTLRALNRYDLIGPKTRGIEWNNTPKVNSLCYAIEKEKEKINKNNLKIPGFCN